MTRQKRLELLVGDYWRTARAKSASRESFDAAAHKLANYVARHSAIITIQSDGDVETTPQAAPSASGASGDE